jgi:hypothetical protein
LPDRVDLVGRDLPFAGTGCEVAQKHQHKRVRLSAGRREDPNHLSLPCFLSPTGSRMKPAIFSKWQTECLHLPV